MESYIKIGRKYLILLIVSFSCVCGFSQNNADLLRKKIITGDKSTVLVVAHRGDWRYAPENSLAAIDHSISVGVDIVELDLQLTKDSVLVIMHDGKLDRTTTGKGNINDWTLDSIKTLFLKSGCGIKTKQKVPTLEEALLSVKGKCLINLDKADRYFDLVIPVAEKTGTTGQIIMKGSKPASEVIQLYGKQLKQVIYMPVVNMDQPDSEALVYDYIHTLHSPAFELIFADGQNAKTPLKMKKMLEGKALIWYNTLWDTLCGGHDDDLSLNDPEAAYGYLINELGARIIQTDRAEHLLNYLRAKGMHE